MNPRRFIVMIAVAFILVVTGCIVTSFVGYDLHPTLSETFGIKMEKGLRGEARIMRDKYGVPHITADNELDLYFAIGYAQAQDRLFQMDMFRRLIEGRLSEVVGDQKIGGAMTAASSTLAQDKIHRIIGYKYLGEAGAALLKEYQPDVYAILESYSAGVNTFIEDCGDKLPMEFRMLDYKPEPWRVSDTISAGRYVGWQLSSNVNVEILKWALVKKLGEKAAEQALPRYRKPVPDIPTIIPREMFDYRKLTLPPAKKAEQQADQIPVSSGALASLVNTLADIRRYDEIVPSGEASNNWVISPKLTASGKPILANDPHLGHMIPPTFWTVHLSGAGYDVYGVTFPGTPFIVLGHNRHLAWGATTSMADVQDVYIEKFDEKGEKYLYKDNWEPITRRKEALKCRTGLRGPVKDAGFVEVRLTRHGPIINDLNPTALKDAPPMALRWTGYDFNTDQNVARALITSTSAEEFMERGRKYKPENVASEADVLMILMKGTSIEDFKKAMAKHALPNQNWVAVDDQGHIGYMTGGRVPVRALGDGTRPVEGWTGDYEWIGFIPPEQLPQVFDPERGYVVTANNEVVPPDDYPYVFSYAYTPGWRAMRIEELLKGKDKLTAKDMAVIQNDVKMLQAEKMVPLLLKALDGISSITLLESQAKKALSEWDFFAKTDSVACSIFNEWRRVITALTLGDELGPDLLAAYLDTHSAYSTMDYMILQGSPFFDNVKTPEIETREDIFRAAFRQAVGNLQKRLGDNISKWQWGKLHTITWEHPLGHGPLARYLNYGPFPHPGSSDTVRNAWYPPTDYRTQGGPCLRHVVDMADVDNSLFVIDGGESGQWKSPHYTDGAKFWYNSEYIKAIMNIGDVQKENEGLLILRPLPK